MRNAQAYTMSLGDLEQRLDPDHAEGAVVPEVIRHQRSMQQPGEPFTQRRSSSEHILEVDPQW